MADPIEIIAADELVAYPGAGSPSTADATVWVGLVNGLITEKWNNPVAPVPTSVKSLALEVGARAARNPKQLASWTRSADDISRTERASEGTLRRVGVYLTEDELVVLNGGPKRKRRRYGTIRVGLGY